MTVSARRWCVRQLVVAGTLVAVVVGLYGCTDRVEHPGPADASASAFQMGPDETSFARVEGRGISVDELMARWREAPDKERRALVDAVIDRDIAAHRSFEDKGLFDEGRPDGEKLRRDLELARKSAMVRALLEREIESAITVDDLEDSSVEHRMKVIRRHVGRPRGLQASHLLVSVPDDADEPSGQARHQARQWIERIRAELGDAAHLQDLHDVAERFRSRLPGRLEIVIDPHLVFPLDPSDERSANLPGDWSRVVAPFREAASELVDDRSVTDAMRESESGRTPLSEPVRTRYGWHVIVPERYVTAKRPKEGPLRELAQRELLREKRRKRLRTWMADLAARTDIVRFSDNLSDDRE